MIPLFFYEYYTCMWNKFFFKLFFVETGWDSPLENDYNYNKTGRISGQLYYPQQKTSIPASHKQSYSSGNYSVTFTSGQQIPLNQSKKTFFFLSFFLFENEKKIIFYLNFGVSVKYLLHPTTSVQAGCGARSFFKQSIAGLNSEYSFS